MESRTGPFVFACLLLVFPLITGQGCGDGTVTPTPSPTPSPSPSPEPDSESPDGEDTLQVTAIYGQSIIELSDLSVWEITSAFGTALTVGAEVTADETSIQEVLSGAQYTAQQLGIRTRRSAIYQINNNGETVELLDGSQWRVYGTNQAIVDRWLPSDAVIVAQEQATGYWLIREVSGEAVRVTLN